MSLSRDPRRSGRGRRSRAGFTFLELLVVIMILGLLASVVVANLDGISSPTQLDGAARGFGNLVITMHDIATVRQHDLILEIDENAQRYRTVDIPAVTDVPDERDREELTYYGDWTTFPRGVSLVEVAFGASDIRRGDTILVTFTGAGEVVPSGFVAMFRHQNLTEDEAVAVEVSGLTGLVSYHRGRFRAEEIRKPEEF